MGLGLTNLQRIFEVEMRKGLGGRGEEREALSVKFKLSMDCF